MISYWSKLVLLRVGSSTRRVWGIIRTRNRQGPWPVLLIGIVCSLCWVWEGPCPVLCLKVIDIINGNAGFPWNCQSPSCYHTQRPSKIKVINEKYACLILLHNCIIPSNDWICFLILVISIVKRSDPCYLYDHKSDIFHPIKIMNDQNSPESSKLSKIVMLI